MGNGMRFSYLMLPDYPLDDAIDMIKKADELGFYACYSVDETWHKDLWVVFAAAARETQQIRFGPNVTHVFLREPTLICQQMATLDELTGGRTEIVVSTGNFGLLAQYKIDWANQKPLSRLKEAMHVMRTFLDEGKITFEGDFFRYSGLYTFARPVQERIPIKMGGMKGPRSFETAGEIADGLHQAIAYSREAYDYATEHIRIGAERAGRDWRDLDIGAWVVTVVSEDGDAARRAARILCAFYISSMPDELHPAPRPGARRARADRRGARNGRHPACGRAVPARVRGEARRRGDARRGRGEDQDRHPARGRQPHDPRAVRSLARERVLGRGGAERAGHQGPAAARRGSGDAGLRAGAAVR